MRIVPCLQIGALAVVIALTSSTPVRAADVREEAFQLALRTAARMGDFWKQRLYADIAIAQARAGRQVEARKSLELASANPPEDTVRSERSMAIALALTGRPREALQYARTVKGESSRAVAIAEVAATIPESAFRADAFREAVSLAANPANREVYDRLETLIKIAEHQHSARAAPEALATLQIAATIAEARTEPNARVSDFSKVIQAMAQIGAIDAAKEVFARAHASSANLTPEIARPDLVRAALAVGLLDIALVEARAVRHSDYRMEALCNTGIAFADRAESKKAAAIFDFALEDMRSTSHQWARRFLQIQQLSRLARKARCPGKAVALIDEQIPAAREMSDLLTRSSMLVYEGQALSELRQEARAVEVLKEAAAAERAIEWEKVQGSAPVPDATPHLFRSLLRLRNLKQAERTLAEFKDLPGRTFAFEQMTRIAVEEGYLPLALKCADRITPGGDEQVGAYLLVATSGVERRH
jgi:hypothetical protein